MQRIKIPFGGLSAEQLEVLAELAEEYSDGILHVTTRQDIQLHFVHIDDTPDLMRRLAAVGITTREACGNSVRNVTACPLAGVCHDESLRRHALRRTRSTLLPARPPRHAGLRPQVQDRLLRLRSDEPAAWPTCTTSAPSPRRARSDGKVERGFEFYVGGGLGRGAASGQAVRRVRARGGAAAAGAGDLPRLRAARREEEPRPRAHQVPGRRSSASRSSGAWCSRSAQDLRRDPRWTAYLDDLDVTDETPLQARRAARQRPAAIRTGSTRWQRTNVLPQAQAGYVVATVTLPLGDITVDAGARRWPISRAATPATRCAPRSSRTSSCAGCREADLPALYARARRRSASAQPGRRHDRRHHRLPGHRHLQARHLVVARPRGGAAGAGSRAPRPQARRARCASLHIKMQRLLQLLRPAPRRRHRLSAA